jgi:hypothetical protein
MLVPFTVGQRLYAATLNAAFDITRVAYQVTDQTVNNTTTFLSSTYLTFSVAAGLTYVAEAQIIYDTNATADFKYNWLGPAGVFIRGSAWASAVTAAAVDATIYHDAVDLTGPWPAGGIASGTMMTVRPWAAIGVGATAGSLTFQFAQNTANASNTLLKACSWIRLTRVS